MDQTTGLVAAFLLLQEDASSLALTEEEAFGSRPVLLNIFVPKLAPGNPEPISDTARLYQAQANPMSYAA
jgi:hypothetical protein